MYQYSVKHTHIYIYMLHIACTLFLTYDMYSMHSTYNTYSTYSTYNIAVYSMYCVSMYNMYLVFSSTTYTEYSQHIVNKMHVFDLDGHFCKKGVVEKMKTTNTSVGNYVHWFVSNMPHTYNAPYVLYNITIC